jgi:hypothetical protein
VREAWRWQIEMFELTSFLFVEFDDETVGRDSVAGLVVASHGDLWCEAA